MFFKKKNDTNIITTRITQTSKDAELEQQIYNKAVEQHKKCPECGHVNESNTPLIGFQYEGGIKHGFYGNCKKCKCKWETVY